MYSIKLNMIILVIENSTVLDIFIHLSCKVQYIGSIWKDFSR